jgi:DNA-binding MarR family transcriptional regulator
MSKNDIDRNAINPGSSTSRKYAPAGGNHREVLLALRRIIRAIDLQSRALIQQCGLTGPQLIVLHSLSELGRVSSGKLAATVSLGQATMTGILARLERRGLIERRRSISDKRRMMVETTPAGEEMLRKAPPLLQESFLDQFDVLESWEQTLIISSLQRVVSMMEATALDATPILTTGPMDGTVEPDIER